MTRIVGPPGSRRRRRFLVGPVLLAMFVGLVFIGGALAVHDEGLFELDANVHDEAAAGDDWSNIFDGTADDVDPKPVQDTGIVADPAPNTIFSTGGSKDDLGINNDPPNDAWTDGPWKHRDGNSPPKDEITNAYAAAYTKAEDGVPHTFIYFGMDRLATEGSANVGFWFFQGNVAPIAGGSFSGEHQVGDVLVLSEFDEGGTGVTIKVFRWVGTGGDEGGGTLQTLFGGPEGESADCDDVDPMGVQDDNVCANVNTAPLDDADIPWAYADRDGNSDIPTAAFFEGGIDLTDLVPGAGCVSNFLAETRSSFEVNAVLKDFVHSSFNLCGDKSGVKFHDLNGNGMRDGTGATQEPGLGGWRINLYADEPAGEVGHGVVEAGQAVLAFRDTAADGSYSFPDLAPGNYIVCEVKQDGWFQSRPVLGQTLPSGETLATCPNSTTGYAFAMTADDRTGNDFGNFQQGTISGTKFKDKNDNGVKDAGDTGLSGWKIHVFNGAGTEVSGSPLTTDGSGNYSISLNPGTYTVCEEITDHSGWVQSYPVGGLNPTPGSTSCTALGSSLAARGWSVTVASQGTTNLRDFGNSPLSKVQVNFLPQATVPDGPDPDSDPDPATRATSINCVPGGGNMDSNTFTTSNLRISDGTTDGQIVCTINYVDP
jgi:SdrD B-like domain